MSLTDRFRAASKSTHSASDALINARLVVLFTDRVLYARALACFYWVFQALETSLKEAFDRSPSLSGLRSDLEALFRSRAFESDLVWYLGPDWKAKVRRTPPIMAYEEHLKRLSEEQPVLLLAHAYTQLLAVASGGQIIRRMAIRQMGLPEGFGTAAFEYPMDAPSPSALRHQLKIKLDALGESLSEDMQSKLVLEHCAAFRHNNAIIRAFRIGWRPFLVGLLNLLTLGGSLFVAALEILLILGLVYWAMVSRA